MTWSTNPNEPDSPPVIFTSSALTAQLLMCDLWWVVHHMIQRKEADHATQGEGLHIYVNVTNGNLDLQWLNADQEAVGDWIYTVLLPELSAASLEHEEGAGHFEGVVGVAIFWVVEDHDDLCEEEPHREGWREGLRPLNFGKQDQAPDYTHPAYDFKMPKTPLPIYTSSDAMTEIERVYI
jgi:hypothetical protein